MMQPDVASESSSFSDPRRRLRAWLEIVVLTALVLSYVWYWEGRFPAVAWLFGLALLALLLASHRACGETARDLGFRGDNLGRAAALVFAWAGPLLVVLVLAGLGLDLHREPPITGLLERALVMPIFGVLQQYLLNAFYLRRFEQALGNRRVAPLLAAAVFGLLHAPTAWLIAATFFVGLGSCWLFRRRPNLWVLGLAHGLFSLTLAIFLADLIPAGLKVGLRAL